MTWGRNARAVFVKDVRAVWWLLAALALSTAMAVAAVTINQARYDGPFSWWDAAVPAFTLLLLAWVTIADPPATSTAFWSTQPLRPSAVVAAKLSFAALAAVIGMLGTTVVLHWWGFAPADIADTATVTIAGTMTWAIAAVLLTLIGGGFRGMVFGLGGAWATIALVRWASAGTYWTLTANTAMGAWCLVVAATAAVLATLYRRRELRWYHRMMSSALLVLLFITSFAARRTDGSVASAEGPSERVAVRLRPTTATKHSVAVIVDSLQSTAEDLALRDIRLHVVRADGSTFRLPLAVDSTRESRSSANTSTMHGHLRRWTVTAGIARLTDDARNALVHPGSRLLLDATVEESAWREAQRLPLRMGVVPTRYAGERIQVALFPGDTGTLIAVTARQILTRRNSTGMGSSGLAQAKFALARRGAPVTNMLGSTSSRWSTGMDPLPGFRVTFSNVEIRPEIRDDSLGSDSAWLASHELVLLRQRPTRAYRIRGEVVVDR